MGFAIRTVKTQIPIPIEVVDIKKDNIANKIEIEIGIRNNGFVEVLSGLSEGDIIVSEGLKKVRAKAKIKPIKK